MGDFAHTRVGLKWDAAFGSNIHLICQRPPLCLKTANQPVKVVKHPFK